MDFEEYAAKAKTEHGHQVALFGWAQQETNRYPELAMLYAIPNGGSRGDDEKTRKIRGALLKAEGVKPGFPDVGLPVARHGYHGLFIEMKKPAKDGAKAGVLSTQQRDFWHPRLMAQGYLVQTLYTFIDARACVCWYLGIPT